MLNDKTELKKIIATVIDLFKAESEFQVVELLKKSDINSELSHYDNWNQGINYYTITFTVPVDSFINLNGQNIEVEAKILEKIKTVIRAFEHIDISQIFIIPISSPKIEWGLISDLFSKDKLIAEINHLKEIMVLVSTGGARINDVDENYQQRYTMVANALKKLGIENPNKFSDLWQFYGIWKVESLGTWAARRAYIGELYKGILNELNFTEHIEHNRVFVDLSGWERINRSLNEIQNRLVQAEKEEQFQAIGLICRETIITLAQAVFISDKHPTIDGVKASQTDAKRMLDAYVATELEGGTNETIRKYARSSNDLANELTHKRTATKKDAALVVSATVSIVNLVGILEGRH